MPLFYIVAHVLIPVLCVLLVGCSGHGHYEAYWITCTYPYEATDKVHNIYATVTHVICIQLRESVSYNIEILAKIFLLALFHSVLKTDVSAC